MIASQILTLPERFRRRAETLVGYLAPADVPWEEAAQLVERTIHDIQTEKLSVAAAAAESGYTTGHLRRLLGLEPGYDRVLPNAGTEECPLIRRCDLPRKPGHNVGVLFTVAGTTAHVASSRSQVARAVAAGE
jgi:hypothetical protein